MLKILTSVMLCCLVAASTAKAESNPKSSSGVSWQEALPGWKYSFPEDHAIHPDFKTEWWYFTGNLRDEKGGSYGYELTFFRQGMLPPARETVKKPVDAGRFVQSDFKFAHFAITDLTHDKFYYTEKINRGAFGEAGFGMGIQELIGGQPTDGSAPLAWIEQWSLAPQPDGSWRLTAEMGGDTPMSIRLRVDPAKPPVIHGIDGVSQKADGLGKASHYYSLTRLKTHGTLILGSAAPQKQVSGESWFDHEWSSDQLGSEQVGWDWFCVQFNDGTELMLYAMRRRDGSVDPVSSGTWVAADGNSQHLAKQDFELRSVRTWSSGQTGAKYPIEWQISVPSQQLKFTLKPRLDAQELALHLISYWEGAVTVDGQRAGQPVKGVGYMELTGYAGSLQGLKGAKKTAAADSALPPH